MIVLTMFSHAAGIGEVRLLTSGVNGSISHRKILKMSATVLYEGNGEQLIAVSKWAVICFSTTAQYRKAKGMVGTGHSMTTIQECCY